MAACGGGGGAHGHGPRTRRPSPESPPPPRTVPAPLSTSCRNEIRRASRIRRRRARSGEDLAARRLDHVCVTRGRSARPAAQSASNVVSTPQSAAARRRCRPGRRRARRRAAATARRYFACCATRAGWAPTGNATFVSVGSESTGPADVAPALPGLVAAAAAGGQKVHFADVNARSGWCKQNTTQGGFPCTGVHPTSGGYAGMAMAWFEVLAPLLPLP